MKILGIHDGHTATAALMVNGKICSVISEERLNRKKEWQGFPVKAIEKILFDNESTINDIDLVVVCGKTGSTNYKDFMKENLHPYMIGFNIFKNSLPKNLIKKNWWVKPVIDITSKFRNKKKIYSFFDKAGFDKNKIIFIDHHTCHAHTTFSNSFGRKDDMLILTLDAAGDGYCGSVNIVKNGKFKTLDRMNLYNSIGLLYSRLTQYLGMKALSHEYKVMGLAAYSQGKESDKVYQILRKKFMRIDPKNPLRFENLSGCVNWEYLDEFDKYFKKTRFDHLAGGAQKLVEELIHEWVINCVNKTGIRNVFCAGGVFMNVKANMKLAYDKRISEIFISPSCGDESNSIGACNYGYRYLSHKVEYAKLEDIYFGNHFSEQDILDSINKYKDKIKVKKIKNINKFTASLLAKGEVVARCSGKMEFGARALGNRSLLGHPNKIGVVREINEAIKMRDFWMPFACTILDKCEEEYILNPNNTPANYMMVTFDTTKKAQNELINGMHQYDFTCRPQVLKRKHNPDYYEIIEHFRKITKIGGVLNTSFNIHGEPIVSMPEEAISTLLRSGLKNLVIDDYYITKSKQNN